HAQKRKEALSERTPMEEWFQVSNPLPVQICCPLSTAGGSVSGGMTPLSPDCELVTAYAARGSETAFRALVARHVHLVYATALRQVGNSTLAEEITQNVFIVLARKAPRLSGIR